MAQSRHYLPCFSWTLLPYWKNFYFGVLASILNKILDLMPPILVAWVIDTVQGTPPGWMSERIPNAPSWTIAMGLSGLAFIIFLFESIFQWMYQWYFQTMSQCVQHDLRCHVYQHIQSHDMAFFENQRLGQLIAIIHDDVNQLERFLSNSFNEIIQLIVLVIFSMTVMCYVSWKLAMVSFIPIPIIIIGSVWYQQFISPFYGTIRHTVGNLLARLENNLSGIAVIKSFTAEAFECARVRAASMAYQESSIRAIGISTPYVPIIRMVIACGFAGVLLLGSYWVMTDTGNLSVGELVLFSMLIQRLLWPLTRLGMVFDEYERSNASAKRIHKILSEKPSITSKKHTKNPFSTTPSITFRDVSFSYHSTHSILKNTNFHIPSGHTVGIVGATGSGKSTLIKCLLRLYDIQSGKILFNDVQAQEINLNVLRQSIALVSQDIYLFHGTIRENIAYGVPHDVSDAMIESAAQMATLRNFIDSCPNTYDSIIGEKGIKLSGGQRQRLSIARAILKNAPIMVFDEATSSVDTETERAIKQNLTTLTHGKTAIIIAHRLSTVRHANTIFVLNDGRITEKGDHDTLIARRGDYHDLWSLQIGQDDINA